MADGVETGIIYFFTTALYALARSQEQWTWEQTERILYSI